jgi:hypothetical protein
MEGRAPEETGLTSLPTSMTAAACMGIGWYLCIELNVRLLIRYTRCSLYFWSCLICSWAILVHLLLILLLNFNIWNTFAATIIVELTWWTYVVSQSVVLYSRLNLVLKKERVRNYVLYGIATTAVLIGLTTVVFGCMAVCLPLLSSCTAANFVKRWHKDAGFDRLYKANLQWDKAQVAVFFAQETIIGMLYIRYTACHLKNMTLLGAEKKTTRRVMHQLIYVNIFIICLDISLLGLCYADYFFLQGFYKATIYAVKLRTEFTILNQLRSTLPGQSCHEPGYGGAYAGSGDRQVRRTTVTATARPSQDSDVEMMGMPGRIAVQKEVVITSSEGESRESTARSL